MNRFARPKRPNSPEHTRGKLRPADKYGPPIDAQVQNVKTGQTYIFGNDDLTDDEINTDEIEMTDDPSSKLLSRSKKWPKERSYRSLKNKSKLLDQNYEIIELPVQEGDTLQNLALKYQCQVAEIKRLNGMIKDQDFYGFRKIKLPLRKDGILHERYQNGELEIPVADTQTTNTTQTLVVNDETEGSDLDHQNLVRTISIGGTMGSQSRDAVSFLKNMDRDIQHIVSSTTSTKDSLDDVTDSLNNTSFYPLPSNKHMPLDCNMRWWIIVIALLLIIPVIYFIYNFPKDSAAPVTTPAGPA